MKRPWMPLYVTDYLADTSHLSTEQHGAYLLLLLHYWKRGSLPAADDQLQNITRMTVPGWEKAKPVLQEFFYDGWKHKRVEAELKRATEIGESNREKARGAANARWHPPEKCLEHASSNGQAMLQNAQSHSPSQSKILSKSGEAKSWTPARHGATSTRAGRVYVEQGTTEWSSYAEDYRSVRGVEPQPNKHGGKWFKTLGEASKDA